MSSGPRALLRLPALLLAFACAAAPAWAAAPAATSAAAPVAAGPPHPAARLIERAAAAARDDPEAARREAEAALAALARAPDPDLEIRARLLLCDYHSESDPTAARAQIAAGRALLPKATRRALAAGLQTCEGEMLEAAGDYSGARAAFEAAARLAADARDDEMLAGALFSKGYLLGVQGEYAAGLADLKRAHSLYEKIGLPLHALTSLNAIAILYNRMGDYAEAKRIYLRALEAQRAAKLRREEGVTLHNIGRAHEKLGEWPQARDAFLGSLAVHGEIRYRRGEAYAIRGLASVANADGDWRRALDLLGRAAALERAMPDARLHAQIDLARGTALRLAGRPYDSLAALEGAERVFARADAVQELSDTYREMAAVHASLGNWRAAYEAQSRAAAVTEKLLRNQLDQRFAALKIEFDTAAREQENTLLIRENAATLRELAQTERARHLQWLVLVLTAVLAVLLATLAFRQWRGTRRMRTLAMTDELTGVPNRRAVLRRLDALLARRDGSRCAIALLDVDHFKSINDEHGHPAGDEVLRIIADRVRDLVAEPAFLGRLGGEEFLVVLPQATVDEARALGERLRAAVMALDASRWFPDGRIITASLGVTAQQGTDDTTSTMLHRADAALYEAKRTGRNRVVSDDAMLQGQAA